MSTAHAHVALPPTDPAAAAAAFAADVRYYLMQTPRQLPSRYLYDALGSALFDAICELPWYHVTRAEMRLLRAHAAAILGVDAPARLVELGPGNGSKLATLVRSGLAPGRRVDLHLVDVSATALAAAARALGVLDAVEIVTHQASYEDGLEQVGHLSPRGGRTLALFLGSNIGNFDPEGAEAFLRHVRRTLRTGDGLLLGADLVKPEADLLLAYDDPLQVTAAFNRNLLVRINRELDGDFDLDSFAHRAAWKAEHSRIEMHLVSTRPQRVRVRKARIEITFREGERIWTESSYKYTPADIDGLLGRSGFRPRTSWVDDAGRFALTMAETD